jgi:hypothetical protein
VKHKKYKRLVPEEYFRKYVFQKTILYPMAGHIDSFLEICNPDTMKSIIEAIEKLFRLSVECGKAQFTYCLANIHEDDEHTTTKGEKGTGKEREIIRETRNSSTKMRTFPMVNKLSPFTSSFLEFLIETKPTDESTHLKKVMTFNDKDFKERILLSSPSASASASTNKKVGNLVSHQLLTVNDPYQTYIATSKVSSGAKGSNQRVKEERGRNSQSKSPSGSRKQLSSKSPTTTTQDHQRNRLKAMKSPRKAVLEAVRRKDTTNGRKGEEEDDDDGNEVMVEFDTVDSHRNTNSGKSRGRPRVGSSEKKKTTHQRNEEEVAFNTEADDIGWTTNHPMVGKKVAAFFSLPNPTETFENILYYGTVMKYAPPSTSSSSASSSSSFSAENDALYRIKWSDGDSEDYDEEQLKRGIDLYLQQTSWITDAKVNSVIGMKVANYFDIVDPMTVTTTTTVKAEKGSNHGNGKKGGKKNGKEKEEIKYIQKIFRGIVIKYLPPSKEYTATAKNNGDGDSTKKKQKEESEKSPQKDHSLSEEMIDNDDKMNPSLSEEEVVKNTTTVTAGTEEDGEEEGDQLYHIKWEDGDEQDYSENELQRARKIYLDHFIHQVLPATLPVFVNPLSSEAKINPSSGKPSKLNSSVTASKSDPVTASWDTSPSKGLKTSTASASSIVSPPKSSSSSSSSNKSLSVTSSSSSKASLTSSHAKKNRGNPSSSSSAAAISSPHATSTYSVSTSSSIFSNLRSDDGRVWLTSGHSCLNHHVAGHFTIPNLSFSSSLGGNKLILLGKVLKYSPETTRRANNALYYIEWEDGAEEVYSQSQYEKGLKIYNVLANKAGQEGHKERGEESSSGKKEKVKAKKRILEQTVDMEEEEEHVLEDEEEEDSEMDLPDGAGDGDRERDDIMVTNSSSVAEERKKSTKLQAEKKQLLNFSRKRKQPEVSQLVENDDEEENSEQNVDDEDDDDDIEIQIEKLPKRRKVTTETMEKEIPVVISSASLTGPSSTSAFTDSSSSSATASTAVEVVSLSSDSIEMQQDVVIEESMLPAQTGNDEKRLETESPPEEFTNDECLKKVLHLEDSSSSLISSAVTALEDPGSSSSGRTHYRFVDNPVTDDGSGDQVTQN